MARATLTVYGITTCATVRHARAWLDDHGVSYEFVNLKESRPSPEQLATFAARLGAASLINLKGTKARTLGLAGQQLSDQTILAWLAREPLLIRRPLLVKGTKVWTGYDPAVFAESFRDNPSCRRCR